MKGLRCLTNLTLEKNGKANPVCHTAGRDLILGMYFVLPRSVISPKLSGGSEACEIIHKLASLQKSKFCQNGFVFHRESSPSAALGICSKM